MRNRWNSYCANMRLTSRERDAIYACIVALYAHPPRPYHCLSHIESMLVEFEAVRVSVESPMLVESAIWFHDCIYDPTARDNESRSADVADLLLRSSFGEAERDVLRALVMATRHDGRAATPDEQCLADLDLAILGAAAVDYDAYSRAIRQEYAEIDWARYAAGRADMIREFLDRPAIYSTSYFSERFESAARANLRRELDALTV